VATLLIEPEADQELEDAALRYEGERPGLGQRFLDAVAATVERSAGSLRLARPCLMSRRTCGLGALP